MALLLDELRFKPLGNTFLPLGDFSNEKADKYRRHTRAHSYAGYVPHRLKGGQVQENKLRDDTERISVFSSPDELPRADGYDERTRRKQLKDFTQHATSAEILTSKHCVDEKAPGNRPTHGSKRAKITANAYQLDNLEELRLQEGGETIAQGNDAFENAMQDVKQFASAVSEELGSRQFTTGSPQQQSCFVTTLPPKTVISPLSKCSHPHRWEIAWYLCQNYRLLGTTIIRKQSGMVLRNSVIRMQMVRPACKTNSLVHQHHHHSVKNP